MINPKSRSVIRMGQEVSLTPKEFDILYFLAENRGEVFTKEQNKYKGCNTINKSQQRTGFFSLLQSVKLAGSYILSRIGRHGRTHRIIRTAKEHIDLDRRCHRSYCHRSQ